MTKVHLSGLDKLSAMAAVMADPSSGRCRLFPSCAPAPSPSFARLQNGGPVIHAPSLLL